MMDPHVSELALEALAHDRADLVPEEERAHAANCAQCQERIAVVRRASAQLADALRTQAAPLDFDLDAVVSAALAAADTPSQNAQLAAHGVRTPSRRSLVLGALSGIAVAALPKLLMRPEWPSLSLGSALELFKALRTVVGTLDGVVETHLPYGWGLVMTVGLAFLMLLALPMRRLLADGFSRGAFPRQLATLAVGLVLVTHSSARALEFEGELPEDKLITLDVVQQPTSETLRDIANAAGLNLVVTLPDDPKVTVRVRKVPLRVVLTAVLGDAPVLVKRDGELLIVRGIQTPSGAPAAPAPPPPLEAPASAADAPPPPPALPPPPPLPSSFGKKRRAEDRVVLGGSTVVHKHERVGDLVTLGGSATVHGTVEGDVVVLGGSTRLKDGAEVFGEIVTIGGSLHTEPGAIVHNGTVSPFDVHHDDDHAEEHAKKRTGHGALVHHGQGSREDHDDDDESFFESMLSSFSRHALLFVLGLVLLGAFPRRLAAVTRTIVESPLRAGALGILGGLGAVVLCALLTITIIGIPAAIVLALGGALALYGGLAASAAVIGAALPIPHVQGHPVRELAAGVFVLFLIAQVPVVGTIALVAACAVGLGAVVRTRFAEDPPAPQNAPPPATPTMPEISGNIA